MGDKMKYLKRSVEGTMLSYKNKEFQKKGLKQSINDLCIRNLSTFEGREKASGILLNRKSILPIYVNKDVFLFPTESIRNYNCIYINYNELLSIKRFSNGGTKIIFYDLTEITVDISYERIKNQVHRVQRILEQKQFL